MRLFATTLVALSLAFLFAMSAPTSAHAAEQPKTPKPVYHTVVEGDTLDKIAQANGTNYMRIFYANAEIEDPDLIMVGEKFRIPSADEVLAERPLPSAAPAPVAQAAPSVASPAPRTTARSTAPAVASGSVWDALAQCESGGNWSINTGNGYYGGLQFDTRTWGGYGGYANASDAPREVQIEKASQIQAGRGFSPWPACAAKLGLL